MTVNAIVETLYKSKELDDCIRKTVRQDHQSDFKHELILLLYEKPHELILSLYNTSGLTYYVVRIILNLVNQNRNRYHRIYNDSKITYDTSAIESMNVSYEGMTMVERMKDEERELRVVAEIKNLDENTTERFPFYQSLVYAVERYGGIRAASRATGIPRSSICDAIKIVRKKLSCV
jgi:hypothetical protein